MPELPEVQTVVDDLNAAALPGGLITDARVSWPRTISGIPPEIFRHKITGHRIARIHRRGKFVVFELSGGWFLIVHLRMTGRFSLAEPSAPCCQHIHVILTIDEDRELRFHDTRKFGRFYLTEDAGRILGKLGPEPLGRAFTARVLSRGLLERSRQIKPLLLDQQFIAGLGNIYVDEALWASKIHPLRPAASLDASETRALHRAIRSVLRTGLSNAGTSLGEGDNNFASLSRRRGENAAHLRIFRRTGQNCPRCRTAIARLLVGQRSTHVCPACQAPPQKAVQSIGGRAQVMTKKP
jgi:formamidopyrimidine-DNA glycosylase